MVVSEAVEACGRALGISTHVLEVEPVANIEGGLEANGLGDVINAIASWAEDAVLDALRAGGVGGIGVVDGALPGAEDLCDWVLVVEHNGREVAVDTVVEVDHVRHLASERAWDGAAGNNVAGQCERRGDVVASWLSDDVDVSWNELIQSLAENNGHALKVIGREAASDIDGVQVVAKLGSLVHNLARIADSFEEGQWVSGAGANVEADTNNVEVQVLGNSEKLIGSLQGCTKLHGEAAQGGGVIGDNADEQLGVWEELLNLAKLVGVVEGHLLDIVCCGVCDVGVSLAWLRIDDAGWVDAHVEDLLDLGLGGAIETSAQCGEQTNDLWVWVALDSYVVLAGDHAVIVHLCNSP